MATKPDEFRHVSIPVVVLIVAAATAAYVSTLLNTYAWDDGSVVANNRAIRSWRNLPLVFSKTEYVPVFHEATYRPIVTVSYFLDGALWQLNITRHGIQPIGGHTINLSLHILCALVLYRLALLLVRPLSATLAGLLFAVHPILSEVVNQVSFREDLLCTAFSLGSMWFFLTAKADGRGGLWRSIAGSLLLAFALLSKEMALAVPVVMVAYEALIRRSFQANRRAALLRIAPYLVVGAVFAALILSGDRILPGASDAHLEHRFDMVWLGRGTSPKEVEMHRDRLGPVLSLISTASAKLAMMPRIFTHHLWKVAVPARLNVEYGWPLERLPGVLPWIVGAMGVLAYAAIAAAVWRRRPLAGFGLLAYALLLTPVSGLMQIAYIVADRFLYLPMCALVLVLGGGLANLIERQRTPPRRTPAWSVISLMLLCFVFLANGRQPHWFSDKTLWVRTVTLNPASAKARVNLGKRYAEQSPPRMDAAIAQYRRAIWFDPNLPPAYVNLSSYYMQLRQYEKAIEVLRQCNERGIFSSLARYNLAASLLQLGNYTLALEHFYALDRKDENVYWQMGMAYHRMGRFAEAEENLRRALSLDPAHTRAMVWLAMVRSAIGDTAGAIMLANRAQEILGTDDCDLWNTRGTIYADAGRWSEAEAAFREAIRCDPRVGGFHYNLATTLAEQGRLQEAIASARRTLEVEPAGPVAADARRLIEALSPHSREN